LYQTKQINTMTTQFTYTTQGQNKKVVIGKSYDGKYFVDIYPEYSMNTSTRYNTKKEAEKRFNSIKKRVSKNII